MSTAQALPEMTCLLNLLEGKSENMTGHGLGRQARSAAHKMSASVFLVLPHLPLATFSRVLRGEFKALHAE